MPKIDIEHMDLVVTCGDVALRIDQEAAVCGLLGRDFERQRTDMNEDAVVARQFAEGGERGVDIFFLDGGKQPLALDFHDVGHFGRLHIVGAGGLRFADQARRLVEIGRRIEPRAHLNHRGFESRGRAAHVDCPSPAKSGSSLPARSIACRSSQPPTWTLPIKICGTVIAFGARFNMACRSALPDTSISLKSTPLRFSKALAAWQ